MGRIGMFERIYVEDAIHDHPRTIDLLKRYPSAEAIRCSRYGEVFNPKRQNFRVQKSNPALILAEKRGEKVLSTPAGYGLGADHHYYFSHMLNCLYDCRYCFLQGMYRSSNFVLFVNYEDFVSDIREIANSHPNEKCIFFSGYDCDSLALESLTGFANHFLDLFQNLPNATLELRTKSVNVSPLLQRGALENVVVAFTLSPDLVAKSLEFKAPTLSARLRAIAKLTSAGWKIGLRFDPLIYFDNCQQVYQAFIDETLEQIPLSAIHSTTIGVFRSPKTIFNNMKSLYPEEPLFMGNLKLSNGLVRYPENVETSLVENITKRVLQHIPENLLFQQK